MEVIESWFRRIFFASSGLLLIPTAGLVPCAARNCYFNETRSCIR